LPQTPLDPQPILDAGLGFFRAKAVLSAIELGVFGELARGPRRHAGLVAALGLQPRAALDLLDGLHAMGFLEREGRGDAAEYANTVLTAHYLDPAKPSYIGGILEMANARLYPFWGGLGEALRTGRPQNELTRGGTSMFETLYADPARLAQFMNAMQGASLPNFHAFAERFDFSPYQTLCDVGGANALLSRIVAARHPHLRCTSWDLPAVEPIARQAIAADGLERRVVTASGDFFRDPLPKADVVTMGMILHDWNLEKKRLLIAKAFDALPAGGAFVAIEHLIDDARCENVFGLMMSLNMLIEFGDAFDYTGAEFGAWCRDAGFSRTEILPLRGPASAAVAYK
jgi:O-methyltransferase/methyltransferase family protein